MNPHTSPLEAMVNEYKDMFNLKDDSGIDPLKIILEARKDGHATIVFHDAQERYVTCISTADCKFLVIPSSDELRQYREVTLPEEFRAGIITDDELYFSNPSWQDSANEAETIASLFSAIQILDKNIGNFNTLSELEKSCIFLIVKHIKTKLIPNFLYLGVCYNKETKTLMMFIYTDNDKIKNYQ